MRLNLNFSQKWDFEKILTKKVFHIPDGDNVMLDVEGQFWISFWAVIIGAILIFALLWQVYNYSYMDTASKNGLHQKLIQTDRGNVVVWTKDCNCQQ